MISIHIKGSSSLKQSEYNDLHTMNHIKKPIFTGLFIKMVQTMRFELTRAYAHYPLKVACLPFHHVCVS